MPHANARLKVRGRLLLVERVMSGRPVAHIAKELGVSRQCAHRWIGRFRREGEAGLLDRSSRPRSSPRRGHRRSRRGFWHYEYPLRQGQDRISAVVGIPPRTVGAILARNQVPRLVECDPLTGVVIRASKQTTIRYERERPGELVHMDAKKLGRIPDGGG